MRQVAPTLALLCCCAAERMLLLPPRRARCCNRICGQQCLIAAVELLLLPSITDARPLLAQWPACPPAHLQGTPYQNQLQIIHCDVMKAQVRQLWPRLC